MADPPQGHLPFVAVIHTVMGVVGGRGAEVGEVADVREVLAGLKDGEPFG